MQYTEYLNLNLPEATDPYDIGNENENMEILDSAIYNHGIILGTTSAAGHVKTINDLTKTSLSNGEALSARMGNALGQMMAPIVTGPNYPSGITKKGDQFVYNGRLCVVTANTVSTSTAINIGSSGNANYASPITSQISDCATKADVTSLSSRIADETYVRAILSEHNLLPPVITNQTRNGITVSTTSSGEITISGTATADAYIQANIALEAGTYILSGGSSALVGETGFIGVIKSGVIDVQLRGDGEKSFTLDQYYSDLLFRVIIFKNAAFSSPITIKPMIRFAADHSSVYRSYMFPRRFQACVDPTAGSSFDRASLVVENMVSGDTTNLASIGFHNKGTNGGTLYLGTDAKLYFVTNTGTRYQISMTQVT